MGRERIREALRLRKRSAIPVAGQPQSQHSPQAIAALKAFFEDPAVTAFYGFSGGGYNLRHILDYLASHKPEALHRIDMIVVLGSPLQPKSAYEASNYNPGCKKESCSRKVGACEMGRGSDKTNPSKSDLPQSLPKDTPTRMFGPDVLLADTPAGRYRAGRWMMIERGAPATG